MREGAAVCRPFVLQGHVFFAKPHQHRRRLSAGGLALGGEGAAVAGAADDPRAAGPLEGGDGILGHSKGVGIAEDVGVLAAYAGPKLHLDRW